MASSSDLGVFRGWPSGLQLPGLGFRGAGIEGRGCRHQAWVP